MAASCRFLIHRQKMAGSHTPMSPHTRSKRYKLLKIFTFSVISSLELWHLPAPALGEKLLLVSTRDILTKPIYTISTTPKFGKRQARRLVPSRCMQEFLFHSLKLTTPRQFELGWKTPCTMPRNRSGMAVPSSHGRTKEAELLMHGIECTKQRTKQQSFMDGWMNETFTITSKS